MRRLLRLSIPIVCCLVGFFSCKKYPENKGISLLSKTQRLTGEWVIADYYLDNGTNYFVGEIVYDTFPFCGELMFSFTKIVRGKIIFKKDGSFTYEISTHSKGLDDVDLETCSATYSDIPAELIYNGKWEWRGEDNTEIELYYYGLNQSAIGTIRKLTNKELIVESIQGVGGRVVFEK